MDWICVHTSNMWPFECVGHRAVISETNQIIQIRIQTIHLNDTLDQSYGMCGLRFLQVPTHNLQLNLQKTYTCGFILSCCMQSLNKYVYVYVC